jgi:hypothetical protein
MLDYIGGDIVRMTPARSGHQVTLQLQYCDDDGEPIFQQFHVRGPQPGQLGERLVVMVLEDEVAGWHNQVTGAQGHLLHRLPRLRWRLRDGLIASATGLGLGWIGNLTLGVAVGLGWLLSTALWRVYSLRSARGELIEALHLAAGVPLKK